MVRFIVKFKEWLLAVPIVTIALAVTTLITSSCMGITDTVMCLICVQIFLVLFDFTVTLFSFNLPVGMSAFAVILIFLFVTVGSSISNVQYVCLVCHDMALVMANIVLLLHLITWQITVENDGFSYRTLFSRKCFYKYSEIQKVDFFNFGYNIWVENKRIKCHAHARNSDALYDYIVRPDLPISKLKF